MSNVLMLAEPEDDSEVWYHPFPDKIIITPRTNDEPNMTREHAMRSWVHRQVPHPRGRDDSFWITGRGPVFTFEHNPAMDLWDPTKLAGEWVLINYGLFLVLGVETFRPHISPRNPYGDRSIGVLVRDHTKLPSDYYDRK